MEVIWNYYPGILLECEYIWFDHLSLERASTTMGLDVVGHWTSIYEESGVYSQEKRQFLKALHL